MILRSSNFRELVMGNIAPHVLFRSNHPVCNGEQVTSIVLSATRAGIKTVVNLTDNVNTLQSKIMHCPWYKNIYDSGNVIALNMNMKLDFTESKFRHKMKDGLLFMIDHDPPFLVHCEAGIDRTGFFCMILEAFMGAAFGDIVRDYMLSYVYTGEYSANDLQNGSVVIRNTFSKIKEGVINRDDDLQCLSKKFFSEIIGLDKQEMEKLETVLGNPGLLP